LTACGSGGGPSASAQTGSGPGPGTVTFAKCMRGHGVPQFPDPGGSRPAGSSVSILGAALPPTININAPAFQSALNTCMKQFTAAHPRPPLSAARKAAVLKFARCMRAHGVPQFPDPTFPANGAIAIRAPVGVDPSSPAFQHAQQACGTP
ncbi:MAG: hypothetical protein ACRDPM_27225, partial [Solirubrobacteraceae bacterium]